MRLSNCKLIKKVVEYRWGILVCLYFLVFVPWGLYLSNPKRAIIKSLEAHGITNYTYANTEIERIDRKHYRLLNPPTAPNTNIALENWETYTIGTIGIYTYAIPLDLQETHQNMNESKIN